MVLLRLKKEKDVTKALKAPKYLKWNYHWNNLNSNLARKLWLDHDSD